MTTTLTPTCAFCGLRFGSSPLLELHVREDHQPRHRSPEPVRDDPGSRPSGPPRDGQSPHDQPAVTSSTEQAATTTGTQRRRAGWAVTALRRTASSLRHADAELLLASKALLRPTEARQSIPKKTRPRR